MNLTRRFPALVVLMVLISITGFCAAQRSVELLLIAGILAALSWYVTEGPRGRLLPRWVSNLLVVAACLSVGVDLLQNSEDVLGVLGRFTIWLTLIKLYERSTPKDHRHLMGLSLLLVLIGALKAASLLFGSLLFVYTMLGLYAMMQLQLYEGRERERAVRAEAWGGGTEVAGVHRPITGRNPGLQFRSLAAGMAGATIVGSLVVFVLFPRTAAQTALGERLKAAGGAPTIGYSDEIDLRGGTRITASQEILFEMEVSDGEGAAVRLPTPVLLRGSTMDNYRTGGRRGGDGAAEWRGSRRRLARIDLGPEMRPLSHPGMTMEEAALPVEAAGSRRVRQEFLFRHGSFEVFSIYAPVAAALDDERTMLYRWSDGTLAAAGPENARRELRAQEEPIWRARVDAVMSPSDELAMELQPSAWRSRRGLDWARSVDRRTLGRVRQLAVDVLRGAGVPTLPESEEERWAWNMRAAGTFARYLSSEPYRYTLDLSDLVLDGADPVETFLFESKRGHCEYFASALAAMCHSIGIEARLVAGYAVNEYDDGAKRYIVRAADAHAWVEVRAGEALARAVDPTPASVHRERSERATDLADRLSRYYDRIEGEWTRRFLSFSAATQSTMASRAEDRWSGELDAARERVQGWLESLNRAFYFGPAGTIWLGLVSLAALLVVAEIVRRVRRARMLRRVMRLDGGSGEGRGADSRAMLRRLGFYVDMLLLLRRHGKEKPSWMPPMRYAEALRSAEPRIGGHVEKLTGWYYAARFGGAAFGRDNQAAAEAEVERLREALRSRSTDAQQGSGDGDAAATEDLAASDERGDPRSRDQG